MSVDDLRPEPEALLAEAWKEGRGKLKVFLGAAPGVGKTYAMLELARRRKAEGVDVVIGIVETHGRAETAALIADLEVLPREEVEYRGRTFQELDLDAVLKRRPAVVVIDELAHSNLPESRHPKRWLDIEEVLDAGIDVFTTLNIQHLESLNDVVARITGVHVRETVPDSVMSLADEIELIDLPAEELIERLRAGKVYVPEQIGRAMQNFFSKGNLTALRELAMRVAADRVDAEMTAHMRSHAIAGPWPAHDRILVCINESPVAKALIRAAKRMAERAHAPWIAVRVITPFSETLPDAAKDGIADAERLADSLGAEVVSLNSEGHVAEEILAFARSRNVTRIVIGRERPRRLLAHFLREGVTQKLIRSATDFEVILISPDSAARKAVIQPPKIAPDRNLIHYLAAAGIVAAASLLAFLVERLFPVADLSLIFLVGVLVTATWFGLWPSLFASVLSFLAYNFFFTEPRFSLTVANEATVLTLVLFLVVSVIAGNLAARLRMQVDAQREIAKRTTNLYEFSRKIASAATFDDVVWAAVHHVASTLNCRSLILVPDADGGLRIAGGYPPEDELLVKDQGAAAWAWDHGEPAGWGSPTLPTADWLFLPLKTTEGTHGLLGVSFARGAFLVPDQRRLLDVLVDQVAIVVERTKLAAGMEETRLLSETERLRAALLSSVSHDLRTPLASILGAATGLLDPGINLKPPERRELVETIRDEGERLNRYVQNLLDMTRISYGALKLREEWIDPRELIGSAVRRLQRELAGHEVRIEAPADLRPIRGDPVLLEQALVNILDNAAKYAPAGTAIEVAASAAHPVLRIVVKDRGAGISEADRPKVFDMFHRVEAMDVQRAGTGLGLAITKGIVEAHGGTVRAAEPADGIGTAIEIELPIPKEPPPSPLGSDAEAAER